MVLCNNCQVMMIPTMSFSHNGNKKYCRCPRCYAETKKQRLIYLFLITMNQKKKIHMH